MTLSRKSLLCALLMVGLTGLVRAQPVPAPAAPPPTKLAVVNIVTLFDKLLEKAAADNDIDQMKRDFEDKSDKMNQAIQAMQTGLRSYTEGSAEFNKTQDDLLQKTMELQAYQSFAQQRLFLELRVRTADLYRKINEAVEKYSKANGIALVFVADNPSVAGARTQEQLQAMVTVRKILYFHPDFDITQKILQSMNTEFELGGGAKPATPVAPATGK